MKKARSSSQISHFLLLLMVAIGIMVFPFMIHILKASLILENHQIELVNQKREQLRSRSINLLGQIKNESHILNSLKNENNNILEFHEINDVNIDKSGKNDVNSNNIGITKSDIVINSDHKILYLSDDEFKETSVGEMMSWYGESDGGGTCSRDFGNELVRRWRDTKKPYCISNNHSKNNKKYENNDKNIATSSSMECFLVSQTRHHGNGDNICLMHDVSINMKLFSDSTITTPVVKRYVSSKHNDQPYIKYPKNFITGYCKPDNNLWKAIYMPGWNVDWSYNGFSPLSESDNMLLECNDRESHNVLVIQRDTFANFFHDSEDFVNAFLSMAILDWKLKDTQLYLTDLYPQGPFWDMWANVYGFGRPVMTAWDIKNKYSDIKYSENGRTCYDNIAIGIYGPAAPITVASWDTNCFKTALVRAYSDFIIRGLNLQNKSFYMLNEPKKTIKVTFMARRASIEWPEKKFCSDTENFFQCEYWNNFGIRKLGRMISNEDKLMSTLKNLEKETFNGYNVIVEDVDYNLLSITKQIETDMSTDIMIGPHGAGLMHNIFMPDHSALIELFVDGSSANRHFHNLAFWYGRKYQGVTTSNPVDANSIYNIVKDTIESIAKKKIL